MFLSPWQMDCFWRTGVPSATSISKAGICDWCGSGGVLGLLGFYVTYLQPETSGFTWVRGRSVGSVFPETHHLAEGACVCSQPGGWCQVVAHSYCYFAASKRNKAGQPASWYFEESAHLWVCRCCWGGGESLRHGVWFCPKEPAVSWLVVLRRDGAKGEEVGWEVKRSVPWEAPCFLPFRKFFLRAMRPWDLLYVYSLLWSSSERARRKTAVPSAHSANGETEAPGVTGLSRHEFQHDMVVCANQTLLLSILVC